MHAQKPNSIEPEGTGVLMQMQTDVRRYSIQIRHSMASTKLETQISLNLTIPSWQQEGLL